MMRWGVVLLTAAGLAATARSEPVPGEDGRLSGNTPLVIEGAPEAPQLSEIPLPSHMISTETELTSSHLAAQRLAQMVGDVESLTGIPEEGFDLPLDSASSGRLPSPQKTRYPETDEIRVPPGVQR